MNSKIKRKIIYCLLFFQIFCFSNCRNLVANEQPSSEDSIGFFTDQTSFEGTEISIEIPDAILSIRSSVDQDGERLYQIQDFEFVVNNDTCNLTKRVLLRGNWDCHLTESIIFNHIYNISKSRDTTSLNYRNKILNVSGYKLYQSIFNNGFDLVGCLNNKTFSISVLNLKDEVVKTKMIESFNIKKY